MSIFVQAPCDEASVRSGDAAVPCSKSSGRWILAATILGSSMVFIDGTFDNVALPALQASLHASVIDVQWVVEAYSLLLSALLLLGGSLGDHYGRRRIFIAGVILFSLASAWCGFAVNIGHLILARAVQGAGGALLVPGSLAIISASFDEANRGRAIGTGEIKLAGQVLPSVKELIYGIDIKRVMRSKLVLGIADGWLKADGELVYQASDLKVALFKDPTPEPAGA